MTNTDWDTDLSESNTVRELREQLREEQETNLLLVSESIAELELASEDIGWRRLAAEGQVEFSDAGLRRIVALDQLMALKNPLIIRGLALRAAYTWGDGVAIAARATGTDGKGQSSGQDVNTVVQAFWDDEANSEFTDPTAQLSLSHALDTDGQVFIACWTRPSNGRVRVRTIPYLEISDVICNPDDRAEPWFYRRDWTIDDFDPTTGHVYRRRDSAYYPAMGYNPAARPSSITTWAGTARIQWDAPVLHVHSVRPQGWKWAVPVVYAACDWGRGYSKFLDDWSKLTASLARYAYMLTGPGRKQAAARAAVAAAPSRDITGEPRNAGATAFLGMDQSLAPVPKTGATIDSDSGRPVAAMVAAALGIPVTMLLGDPGVTGARATAQTLDRPTELTMLQLRRLWTAAFRRILDYVIDSAVRAPRGDLRGAIIRDDATTELVTLADDTDRTIDISWPPMEDIDITKMVAAIVQADSTGKVPPLVVARLLLEVLRCDDIDEILEQLTDADGNFRDPLLQAGTAALAAFRRGEDPAVAMGGEPPPDPNVDPAAALPAE